MSPFPEGHIRILHVDDEPDFADLTAEFLGQELDDAEIHTETDAREALSVLESRRIDCVVSDYQMPGMDGLEFLETLREDRDTDVPFLMFTGKGREEVAMEALNLGADRYIQKGGDPKAQFGVLAQAIEQEVSHHRTQRELERSADIFGDIFDRSGLGLVIVDPETKRVVDVNEAAAGMYGRPKEELIGSHPDSYRAVDASDAGLTAAEYIHRTIEEGPQEFVWKGERADGTTVWNQVVLKAATIRGEERIVGIVRDITDERARQERLRQYEQAIQQSSTLIAAIDPAYRYLFANDAYLDAHGVDRDHVCGEPIDSVLEDDTCEKIRPKIDAALDGEAVEFEMTRTLPDRGERTLSIQYSPLVDDDEPAGVVAWFRDVTDRKEREQELDLYHQLIDASNAMVFVNEADSGNIVYANQTACRELGYEESELLGRKVSAIETSFEDRDEFEAHIEEVREKGTMQFEGEQKRRDGSTFPVEVSLSYVSLDTDYMVAVARDISERKERLRDLELFRTLVDEATDSIFVIDEESARFVDANETAAERLGYDVDALTDMTVPDISTSFGSVEEYLEFLTEEEMRSTDPFKDEHIRADGTTIPVEVTATVVEVEGTQYRIAIARDVSRRKEREQALADLHDAAQSIETAETPDEVYQRVVQAAENILDFDIVAVDILEDGQLVQAAYSTETDEEGYYETVPLEEDTLATRAFRDRETKLVCDLRDADVSPADPKYMSALTVPIGSFGTFQAVSSEVGGFDETDRELAELLVGHARETLGRISGKKALERRSEELERQNERLSEFASIVSHDLRNPLNVATGKVNLAIEECDSTELEDAADALDRMDTLIEATLEMARGAQMVEDLDTVDAADLVGECFDLVESPGATIELASNFSFRADRDRVKHVFENLFTNAIEHAGRDVTVRVGPIDEEGFYVEDDGPGIPEPDREDVFERGFTTAEDGTGYGLAIVKEIVEAHDWDVSVTENPEGGARFEVTGVRVE